MRDGLRRAAGAAAGVATALAVPCVAIALNVQLLASGPYLRLEFARPGFPAAPGFTDDERLALALPSTRFIVEAGPRAALAELGHEGRPLYTPEEIDHLLDVRQVVARLGALGLAGALWLLVAALAAWRARQGRWLGRALAWGGGLTLGLVVAAGLGIGLAWPLVFVGFHELAFPAGNWQFPVDSGLIRLFPEPFWYDSAFALAALSAAEGLLALLVGRWLRRRSPA